jgi:hypothetical protein
MIRKSHYSNHKLTLTHDRNTNMSSITPSATDDEKYSLRIASLIEGFKHAHTLNTGLLHFETACAEAQIRALGRHVESPAVISTVIFGNNPQSIITMAAEEARANNKCRLKGFRISTQDGTASRVRQVLDCELEHLKSVSLNAVGGGQCEKYSRHNVTFDTELWDGDEGDPLIADLDKPLHLGRLPN